VTVYDFWEDGEKAFIAMEYVDGVELKYLLAKRGSVDFVSAVRIAVEVCRALQYAHARGMIHRDVKPGNIMLSRKGQVRLMDFGIVSVSGRGDLTITGQMVGTPAYMSPEQISSEGLGPASDMFGLGSVLYEMLTGERPFQGDNQLALIQRILHGNPAAPVEIVPGLPVAISDAILRCLEKDPESRFSSMDELAAVLVGTLPENAPSTEDSIAALVAPYESLSAGSLAGGEEATVREPSPETGAGNAFNTREAHPLEMDPPADLPPLETGGTGERDDPGETPITEENEIELSLRELPPAETEEPTLLESSPRKGGMKRYFLWLLPVILLAAAVAWIFARGGPSPFPASPVEPAGPAFLAVVAQPGARLSVDGKDFGLVDASGAFEIPAGLHKVEVTVPGLGVKTYIVEVEPGERKRIEVRR
jgi:serine/threonine protein kinase